MTEKDARIARKVMVDELDTINTYSAMAENADSEEAKDVVDDIADEEKVHVGEAAALLDENDPRAKPAMLEGVEEVRSFKESAKQTYFSPYTGKLQAKPPKIGDAGEPHHTRWEDMSEEMKKKTNPERYERELKERNTHKRASASFRDVFAQKRGSVIAKANGRHIEKDANWKHAGPEAVDYVEQKKMPNTEFLRMTDHPMGDVKEYRDTRGPMEDAFFLNKPEKAIYGAKYTPKGKHDSGWVDHVKSTGFDEMDIDTGEIYTPHPDSRVLIIHNPQEFKDMAEKYRLFDPVEGDDLNMAASQLYDRIYGNSKHSSDLAKELLRGLKTDLSTTHPSYKRLAQDYDHIYFPNPGWSDIDALRSERDGIEGPNLDTDSLITLNDFLADGKTPTRILQRPYTPRDQRVAQGQQDDSRKDYVPEKDTSLGFMAEGGREPSSSSSNKRSVKGREKSGTDAKKGAPKVRHSDVKEGQGLVDREGKGGSKGKKDKKPKEEKPKRDPTKPEPGRTKGYGTRDEIRQKRTNARQNRKMDAKLKQADEKPEKETDTVSTGATGTSGNIVPKHVQNYIAQAKKLDRKRSKKVKKARNPQSETANKLADKRTRETRDLPLAQAVNFDSWDTNAMNMPTRGLYPSTVAQLVDDPADLEVGAYDRHNTPDKDRLPKGEGLFSDQNWKTIGGTFQVRPIYVNAKDASGNIIYDVKRVPEYVKDGDGRIQYEEVEDIDEAGNRIGGTRLVPVVRKDAQGNPIYKDVKTPKKELLYNLVLTKKGKNRAAAQKLIGRIRTRWNPNLRQWVPVGMEDLTDKDDIRESVFGLEAFANQPLWNKEEGYAQPYESQYNGENLFELPKGNDMSLPPIFQTMRGMAGIREMEKSGIEQIVWNTYMTEAKIDLWDELYGHGISGGTEKGWNDLTPEERADFENKAFELAKERRAKDEVANNEAIDLMLANDTKHKIYREKAKQLANAWYKKWKDQHPEMKRLLGKDGTPLFVKYTRTVPINGGQMVQREMKIPYDQFLKWRDMTYEVYLDQVRIEAYRENKAEMEEKEKMAKQNLDNRSALFNAIIANTVAKYRQKNGLDDWADVPMEELARSVSAAINNLSDEEVAQHPAVIAHNEERQNINAEAERQNRAIYHDNKMLDREFSNNRINADKIYTRTDAGKDYLKRIGDQVQRFNDRTNEDWQNVSLYNAIQEMLDQNISGDADYQGTNEILDTIKNGSTTFDLDEVGVPRFTYGGAMTDTSKVSPDDARRIVDSTLAYLTPDVASRLDPRWGDLSDLGKVHEYAVKNGIDPAVMLRTALRAGNSVRRMRGGENDGIPMDTVMALGDTVKGLGIPTTVSDRELMEWAIKEGHSGQSKDELRMIRDRVAKEVETELRQRAIASFQRKFGGNKMPTERSLRKYLNEEMDRNKGPRRGMTRLEAAIEDAAMKEFIMAHHDELYDAVIRDRLGSRNLGTAPQVEERREAINQNIIADREKPWEDAKESGFYAAMIEDLVDNGMSPEEAEAMARRKFEGNSGQIPKKPTAKVTDRTRQKETEANTPAQDKKEARIQENAVITEGDAPPKANIDTSLGEGENLTPERPKETPKSRGGVAGGADLTRRQNKGYDPNAKLDSDLSQYVDLGNKKKTDESQIEATSGKKKKTPKKESKKKETEHKEKSIPSFHDVFSDKRGAVLRKHHGI